MTAIVIVCGQFVQRFVSSQSAQHLEQAIAATETAPNLKRSRTDRKTEDSGSPNAPTSRTPSPGATNPNAAMGAWEWWSDEDLGIEVEFPPGRYYENSKSLATQMGDLDIDVFGVEASTRAYTVMHTAFPRYMSVVPIQTMFDSAIDGVLSNVQRRIEPDREIEVDGYPGYVMHYEGRDGLRYRHYIYVADQHLFQVVAAASDRDDSFTTDSTRFLESFKFLY